MKIIYSSNHTQHDLNQFYPHGQPYKTSEIPQRVESILTAVNATRLGTVSEPGDFGMEPILAVHTQDYVDLLSGNGNASPIQRGAWQAAYWSAMCAVSGARELTDGERTVFALCRPPGHHATRDNHGGFCYLNNAAIAARQLQPKVAILDIDYHHGNGTQEIFYSDPEVLFCSLHANLDESHLNPLGLPGERGIGQGKGYNSNLILPKMVEDREYLAILDQAVETIHEYQPRYLIISAGFDTAADDPVGGSLISHEGIQAIGARIAGLALPTLIILEGGYRIETLGANVVAFLSKFN